MIHTLYFPLVAVLASDAATDHLTDCVFGGRWSIAQSLVEDEAQASGTVAARRQLNADMLLAKGDDGDAENCYHDAQRVVQGGKQLIQYTSLRNTGWQALYRGRPSTALSCFARLTEDGHLAGEKHAEATVGIICSLFALGQLRESLSALQTLTSLISLLSRRQSLWQFLFDVLRDDLEFRALLLSSAPFTDHIYWQNTTPTTATTLSGSKNIRVSGKTVGRLPYESVLHLRAECLEDFRKKCSEQNGDRHVHAVSLTWAKAQGLIAYENWLLLDSALCSIASGALVKAEYLLKTINRQCNTNKDGWLEREFLYANAKLKFGHGCASEALTKYAQYAQLCITRIRDDMQSISDYMKKTRRYQMLDENDARLPAKYRKAYSFIQANLERPNLTVAEIAMYTGVSQRALQMVFMRFLGLTPAELIRQSRLDRIDAALMDFSTGGELSVTRTSSRWGMSKNSTALTQYRKKRSTRQ